MSKSQKEYQKRYRKKKRKKRKEADKLWKEAVFKEYGELCVACKEEPANESHHFFPKGSYGHLRYAIENGVPICRSCHYKFHTTSDPTTILEVVKQRGWEWYNEVKDKAKNRPDDFKTNLSYYEKVIEDLNKFLKENDNS